MRMFLMLGALTAGLAACDDKEIIIIEQDEPYSEEVASSSCVLDIRVDEQGRTIWKGEPISNEEFDRRLRAGQISDACIDKRRPSGQ